LFGNLYGNLFGFFYIKQDPSGTFRQVKGQVEKTVEKTLIFVHSGRFPGGLGLSPYNFEKSGIANFNQHIYIETHG